MKSACVEFFLCAFLSSPAVVHGSLHPTTQEGLTHALECPAGGKATTKQNKPGHAFVYIGVAMGEESMDASRHGYT